MDIERINNLLKQKEGVRLEFKAVTTNILPKSLFESICAMLNRDGGNILLGVQDNGIISGISTQFVDPMIKDLVNLSNNPSKLDPPFIIHPKEYKIQDKIILHIAVPESSEIHKCTNIVFDRGHEGDYKVTQPSQIALLYNRKRSYYSEGIVYPYLTLADFKPELFKIARSMIRGHTPNHPWLNLDDEQFMKIAGLYSKDPDSNREGYNLAAVLLFGRDATILNIVPHYKIDALVRREDLYRYDDRLYIQTNLIEAYDLLMSFTEKHLTDKFFLLGDQRISLRSHIFREVIANLIVHREYQDGSPSNFIIYKDRVEITNANNPHGNGRLLPESFLPFSKNPIIAKFFIQLGRVDELGSGVINVYRYLKDYSPGREPQFIEDKIFKTIIPIGGVFNEDITKVSSITGDAVNDAVNDAVSIQVRERLAAEIKWIQANGNT
ncbi:MAG: putative DNA binding domain-containing protein, partial [Nitrososphaeraceae archaeon]|nr:putative DNA binding domain-containing protein [Nitrososphaeraceae archaeon]